MSIFDINIGTNYLVGMAGHIPNKLPNKILPSQLLRINITSSRPGPSVLQLQHMYVLDHKVDIVAAWEPGTPCLRIIVPTLYTSELLCCSNSFLVLFNRSYFTQNLFCSIAYFMA
jgi:hypothetical protein